MIVGVKFSDKFRKGEFYGREYSYFVADGITLCEGDVIKVPTSNGEGTAMVTRLGIKESEIDERVMPYMKTITSGPIEHSVTESGDTCQQMRI